jgi:hypothetical protein
MSQKKALALTGLLLILGAGLASAQEQKQADVTTKARNKAQAAFQDRSQNRMRFQDQNGDGINDFGRDRVRSERSSGHCSRPTASRAGPPGRSASASGC